MSTMTRSLLQLLLVISSAALLYGQGGAYGTILGTVKDNSGAVVANASVVVTNVATNVIKNTETTSSGDFCSSVLAPCRPSVNRVKCAKEQGMPSASMVGDLSPTTIRWTV